MSLNPLGTSTGMDINSMVSKIVDSERIPKQQRIDREQARIDTSISAYGRLRESLDTMKNLMADFRREEAFAVRKVESTDEEAVSATATTDAIAGKYAIDVLQLAQSHKVASDPLEDDLRFGPGKLQIQLGERKFAVEVKENSRLMDVVRNINEATGNPGVRASVINDAEGQRLILASDRSGAENQIKIGVESEAGNPLKRLEYKTLEERVNALEEARNAAAEALAAPIPGQEVADTEDSQATQMADEAESGDPASQQSITESITETGTDDAATAAAAAAGALDATDAALDATLDGTAQSILPEDTIPGWTGSASGTLLDSYTPPEAELDTFALEKMSDVPGWSMAASGTLTDSYETPKEAEAAKQQLLAERKAAIEAAIEAGEITEEEGHQLELEQMEPAERERQIKIDDTQAALEAAQQSVESYSGMTEIQAAQDSMVMLDGIAQLSSENNVIEDAIQGIDITVKGVTDPEKKKTEIGVEYDRQSVRDDIEQFVSSYNQFYQLSRELAAADPATGMTGPLAGDSIVRSAESRLKTVFTSNINAAPEDLKTLSSFGITTTRQGTLEINYSMLDRQLTNNFTRLGEFFGGKDGFAKKVEDAIQTLTGATGTIRTRENSLRDQTYRLQDDQVALNRRMESLEERTMKKFSAMQDVTAKMQSQFSGMMSALG
ncbi:flagellar filament capping protein FliD [Vibrio sp. JC009]|uniref:flagellar filament capping protein FliD n=1 Tax=Vibrio sp. JC009 TaxID=2912314 RepID=UPI0023B1E94D|nr:flagellar filament capping protein FliD [Vibrio sp. JC009]WED21071.1 flagellar filament capping protein FliD [Vibrio sp. JC009]